MKIYCRNTKPIPPLTIFESLGLDAQNHAAEVKIRAERKAGDLLLQLERSTPKGNGSNQFAKHSSVEYPASEYREVLEEQDIPTTTAHRWQQAAQIPEKTFEQHIAQVKDAGITWQDAARWGQIAAVPEQQAAFRQSLPVKKASLLTGGFFVVWGVFEKLLY